MVFETPNILIGRDSSPLVQVMCEMAAANTLLVLDTYTYTSTRSQVIIDRTHPSPELYKLIGNEVLGPGLTPLVDKLLCNK